MKGYWKIEILLAIGERSLLSFVEIIMLYYGPWNVLAIFDLSIDFRISACCDC